MNDARLEYLTKCQQLHREAGDACIDLAMKAPMQPNAAIPIIIAGSMYANLALAYSLIASDAGKKYEGKPVDAIDVQDFIRIRSIMLALMNACLETRFPQQSHAVSSAAIKVLGGSEMVEIAADRLTKELGVNA